MAIITNAWLCVLAPRDQNEMSSRLLISSCIMIRSRPRLTAITLPRRRCVKDEKLGVFNYLRFFFLKIPYFVIKVLSRQCQCLWFSCGPSWHRVRGIRLSETSALNTTGICLETKHHDCWYKVPLDSVNSRPLQLQNGQVKFKKWFVQAAGKESKLALEVELSMQDNNLTILGSDQILSPGTRYFRWNYAWQKRWSGYFTQHAFHGFSPDLRICTKLCVAQLAVGWLGSAMQTLLSTREVTPWSPSFSRRYHVHFILHPLKDVSEGCSHLAVVIVTPTPFIAIAEKGASPFWTHQLPCGNLSTVKDKCWGLLLYRSSEKVGSFSPSNFPKCAEGGQRMHTSRCSRHSSSAGHGFVNLWKGN